MTREHVVRDLITRMKLAASLTRALQLAQTERQDELGQTITSILAGMMRQAGAEYTDKRIRADNGLLCDVQRHQSRRAA